MRVLLGWLCGALLPAWICAGTETPMAAALPDLASHNHRLPIERKAEA